MATNKILSDARHGGNVRASSSVEEMLVSALERDDNTFQTGRYLVTLKEGGGDEGLKVLGKTKGMRIADARDFEGQAVTLESVGDADAVILPEMGVILIGGDIAQEQDLGVQSEISPDSPFASIDPEYFVFADGGFNGYVQGQSSAMASQDRAFDTPGGFAQPTDQVSNEYLRGFLRAAEIISNDLKRRNRNSQIQTQEEVEVLGATWGLNACKVPPSLRSGAGIKVAGLGIGFDFGHPDFAGRVITGQTFVGQPVQFLGGVDTHNIGTACGPKAPAGNIPRYGIGYRTSIFVGKVLSNSGTGTMASVLAGMNWAIANKCAVIFTAVGGPGGPIPAYTAAGQAALNNGCLIIAAAGHAGSSVGAPANSPTIMSVAALNQNLQPASFSNFGKIDIAAPGVDIFSSWSRPIRYSTISGTSAATAHVAGCAALWAETSPSVRGIQLWKKLQLTAKPLPFPPPRVGAGLTQAP